MKERRPALILQTSSSKPRQATSLRPCLVHIADLISLHRSSCSLALISRFGNKPCRPMPYLPRLAMMFKQGMRRFLSSFGSLVRSAIRCLLAACSSYVGGGFAEARWLALVRVKRLRDDDFDANLGTWDEMHPQKYENTKAHLFCQTCVAVSQSLWWEPSRCM